MKPHWVLVQTLPSGVTIYDADHSRILGLIPGNFTANTAIAPDLKHFYVAQTLWSLGDHGTREDMLTSFDASTLDITHETTLPPRALTVFKEQDFTLSADGHTAYVFNLTPATSVTVVDLTRDKIASHIDIPGCGLTFPWRNEGFSALCGDGTLLNVALGPGDKPTVSHSKVFFAATEDPVFESSLVDVPTGRALFITFSGKVFPTQLGPHPVIGAPWSLQVAAGQPQAGTGVQELAWRPGGYQIAAWHKASNRLFVLMHPGTYWTQKKPGTEVWVFDIAAHRLLRRIELQDPAGGIAVSQDKSPLLYATSRDGKLAVINADTGEPMKSTTFDGGGPIVMVAGQ